ncbi:hypothetical protein A3D78_02700 [Candidatus Gottesmanbacteria bacterium RIFCSPHIGHO2_02_FULL_39_14]|uniref:Uncharacterized protein n=2 Tax=Candidatus Gottesmaniibacteriota TaxID=1752720 RepID=A0A1F5ZVR3_9BACT|nr:MAG: hypothetical protein A3D78_02700 [Candidatus Gottesmanbacteria bacterium RIFCSPHIGHO2_02_FULL_39_14]OGG31419.1 MAG: hypothetical protein A3I51_01195 [Candidatus Gottesmanbacteria bacterium RIFCSPLOWO2_02_FULL_38_8]
MKRKYKFSILISGSLILIITSVLYFAYYRVRRGVILYTGVSLVRTINIQSPYFWVPQWVDSAIKISDKDISPIGMINAQVLDKESVEATEYGRYDYLLLKVNAIRDRTGIYLFKNKPLAVGNIIQLRFPKTNVFAYIQTLDEQRPISSYKKVRILTRFKEIEPFKESWIKIGNEVKNSKGETIAKVIDKTTTLATKEVNTASGNIVVGTNPIKRDVDVLVELLVKELDGIYYFTDTYKIKPNEQVFIPWPTGHLTHYILSVEPF